MSACALARPLSLTPRPEARIWGGRRLGELFGRTLPDGPIGESWEVCGDLVVSDGPLAGRTLDDLVAEWGVRLLGRRLQGQATFPLLIKWLDCRQWLSVQVHPDDTLAREFTGRPDQRGKSEAWYVAQAEQGGQLIHGLRPGVRPQQLLGAEGPAILDFLDYRQALPGDFLFTPAGTIHALGPGVLIYEVQQACDLTYRWYDWGRARDLHPRHAFRCLTEARPVTAALDERGVRCRYFEMECWERAGRWDGQGESFAVLTALDGQWQVEGDFGCLTLSWGQSVLLPACLGSVGWSGQGRLMRVGLGSES